MHFVALFRLTFICSKLKLFWGWSSLVTQITSLVTTDTNNVNRRQQPAQQCYYDNGRSHSSEQQPVAAAAAIITCTQYSAGHTQYSSAQPQAQCQPASVHYDNEQRQREHDCQTTTKWQGHVTTASSASKTTATRSERRQRRGDSVQEEITLRATATQREDPLQWRVWLLHLLLNIRVAGRSNAARSATHAASRPLCLRRLRQVRLRLLHRSWTWSCSAASQHTLSSFIRCQVPMFSCRGIHCLYMLLLLFNQCQQVKQRVMNWNICGK